MHKLQMIQCNHQIQIALQVLVLIIPVLGKIPTVNLCRNLHKLQVHQYKNLRSLQQNLRSLQPNLQSLRPNLQSLQPNLLRSLRMNRKIRHLTLIHRNLRMLRMIRATKVHKILSRIISMSLILLKMLRKIN